METTSFSDQSQKKVIRLLIPNTLEVLLYLLLGCLFLFVTNARILWNYFNKDIGSYYTQNATGLIAGVSNTRLTQIVFWMLIGALLYTALWFLKAIVTSTHNDIIAGGYSHPPAYSKTGFWESVLLRKILFATTTISFIVGVYISAKVLSDLGNIVRSAFHTFDSRPAYSCLQIAQALGITMLLIYVLNMLLRLAAYFWRVVSTDL